MADRSSDDSDVEATTIPSPFIDTDDHSQTSDDDVLDESAEDSEDDSPCLKILGSISSGLQRITQTGCTFSCAGVSLDVIIPVVFRLDMGRDPSEDEMKLWISLAKANISNFADYDGAALKSIPTPVPQKRSNKGFSKMRTASEEVPCVVLYLVVLKRALLSAFDSAQKARRSSLSPQDLGTPRTLFGLGIILI